MEYLLLFEEFDKGDLKKFTKEEILKKIDPEEKYTSPEQLKTLSQKLSKAAKYTSDLMKSKFTNEEKAEKFRKFLKVTGIISLIKGTWDFLTGIEVIMPHYDFGGSINPKNWEWVEGGFEFGPTFFLWLGLILFLIRFLNKVIIGTVMFTNKMKGYWNNVKRIFKGEDITKEEYEFIIKEAFEYENI